ncbi:MAG: MATE family efflux transporter [Lachnospiraceae bacterium]|nr:MATE family efflux transporter [Lachnospiraceae bacterium]
MLVQALYNIVDSFFVAKIGESALTAVTVAFPMQSLMIAVSSGTGVGINAMLSSSLGAKHFDKSDSAANNGVFLAFCSYVAFALLGLFAAEPFIATQSQTPEVIEYGTSYLKIVTILSIGLFCQMTFERLLQSTGLTFYSMITQTAGAVTNIILDPIMIFGLFGCPAFGVAGAAYATVIGQCVAGLLALIFNLKVNKEIHFKLENIVKPDAGTIGRIYAVGVPSILMMSIMSVMSFFMNKILSAFSETAVAVYGVYFRLQSFFFMPVFGMNNGIIPVLAYNFGAKKRERIDEALKFGVVLAVSIMTVGTAVFELFPDKLLDIFEADANMKAIGIPAMRIIAIHFPFAAVAISLGTVFQAFSKSIYSLIISICRQLLILLPVAWAIAAITGDVGKVWYCFLASEGVSCILSIIFFKMVYKETVEPMGKTQKA